MEEWNHGNKHVEAVFEGMFPSSYTNEKVDKISVMTKLYNNYKSKYVRHLIFDPKKESLSKATSNLGF